MTSLAVVLIALALAALILAMRTRARTGLPWAPVRADDARAGRGLERALVARRYGLSGKPDYIIERAGRQIPVEVKPGRHAPQPYESDLMQLAAYCLLIEETSGNAPPYGILRYAEASFQLRYTPEVRADLLAILDEMRDLLNAEDAERSHSEPGRCAGCGFTSVCEDSLA
ncbi:CRISPR-associated protein Cas4 [Oscillochloris sp. ZM17-4]|uniref:CRISPR-associated protein Cas4 n=1 Tax=Oscillochloris sp. ZM17-4 TaxID=2866714 RepID=UPI001C73B649|nr:CRISPR-associated protein Cas4 [Oscillochloris sp. ZM17-4]MBX0328544.1 CRISPR-associated protein Cas4 [Oscillochloris sp. ZM17-4]